MSTNTWQDLMAESNREHDALEMAQTVNEQEQLDAIKDAAPKISSGAMLVGLTISVWEGRKLDKKASEDITLQNHAKKDSARVNKSLMADCEYLKAIKAHRGVVRNHIHYKTTLPWIHNGPALLTTGAYFDYKPAMDEARDTFWAMVEDFLNNYQSAVLSAQVDLGDMFDPNDYPHPDDLRHKFKFEVDYIPLSESGDFRLDIGQDAVDHLSSSYETYYAKKFSAAMADIWQRLMEPLANMVDRLDYADHETKKVFKGTLVDNVLDIVDLMRVANVTEDPQMSKIENELRAALQGITPEALREDGALRAATHKVALDALKETKRQIDNLPSIW